jgi:hypothetical protein
MVRCDHRLSGHRRCQLRFHHALDLTRSGNGFGHLFGHTWGVSQPRRQLKKVLLRTIGTVGALLFGAVFAMTFIAPEQLERRALGFLKQEVSRSIDEKIDGIALEYGETSVGRYASKLYRDKFGDPSLLKEALKARFHALMETAIGKLNDGAGRRPATDSDIYEEAIEFSKALFLADESRLIAVVQSSYARITAELLRDVRIFTFCNAIAFLFLLLASLAKKQQIDLLFWPGMMLFASILCCTASYLLARDWLWSMIYSDYMGFGYLGYVATVFLLLSDIVLNRARVLSRLFGIRPSAPPDSASLPSSPD